MDKSDLSIYLDCLDILLNKQIGVSVDNKLEDEQHFSPYIRA